MKPIKLTDERLAELKRQHGQLHHGRIALTDPRSDERVSIEFLYREPTYEDAERLSTEVKGSPLVAYRNLLAGIVVAPERAEILRQMERYPYAMMRFMDRQVMPFFGEDAEVGSSRVA